MELKNEVFEVYVNDTTDVMAAVDPGVRFNSEKLVKHAKLEEEDEKIPEDEKTTNLLNDIANTIYDCVQFTVDCTSSHQEGKVPILDQKVKTKDKQILHDFYEKSCASKMVIPYMLAHSRKMNMAEWSRKLTSSGYPETVRHEVMIRKADER